MKAATRRQQEQVSKKKKNAVILPQHMIENESLELVASPIGPIRTNPVSASDAQIILDRSELGGTDSEALQRWHRKFGEDSIRLHNSVNFFC